jgi:hypothetical protein
MNTLNSNPNSADAVVFITNSVAIAPVMYEILVNMFVEYNLPYHPVSSHSLDGMISISVEYTGSTPLDPKTFQNYVYDIRIFATGAFSGLQYAARQMVNDIVGGSASKSAIKDTSVDLPSINTVVSSSNKTLN